MDIDGFIKVSLFGSLSLKYKDNTISDDMNRARRVWNLLGFLLANRYTAYTQDKLYTACCHIDRGENPSNVLKNLVCRVRRILSDCNFPPDCILFTHEVYRWNPSLSCQYDIDLFESLVQSAADPLCISSDRINDYRQAVKLYADGFLPQFAEEPWVLSFRDHYRELFFKCIDGLYALMAGEHSFHLFADICRKALIIEPLNEHLYVLLIRALVRLSRHAEALQAYETITNLLYTKYVAGVTGPLSAAYTELYLSLKDSDADIFKIHNDLYEKDETRSAYFCDYTIFKYLYRFLSRNIERTGQDGSICLLSLTSHIDQPLTLETLQNAVNVLHDVLLGSLRRGDVVSRFSQTQYMILLCSSDMRNSNMVMERIVNAFYDSFKCKDLVLKYKLHAVSHRPNTDSVI